LQRENASQGGGRTFSDSSASPFSRGEGGTNGVFKRSPKHEPRKKQTAFFGTAQGKERANFPTPRKKGKWMRIIEREKVCSENGFIL